MQAWRTTPRYLSVAILLYVLVVCMCGCHGGEHVTFALRWDKSSADGACPRTFVLAETRRVTEGVHMPSTASLEVARGWLLSSSKLEVQIPILIPQFPPFIYLPPIVIGRDREYRLTLFSPGHRAVTIYPEGMSNRPTDHARGSGGSLVEPAYLRATSPGVWTCLNTDGAIPYTNGPDGACFEVKMLKLPLERISRGDAYTFLEQVRALREAIKAGFLNNIRSEERRLLAEAVRVQHDSFIKTIREARDPDDPRTMGIPPQNAPNFGDDIRAIYEDVEAWCGSGTGR